ncbi:Glutamate receptor [Rhynchospora pubera]|uniref:Glutamate receptor n=1 Tax=Rhynchospora pubera TaxID=906938 RepID=A0AAV8H718_9POAL|nr:Glutamate receptor [Rhynchospora pubera]
MQVEIDPEMNAIKASGYSIDVFEEAVKRLPYAVPYEYELFGGVPPVSSESYNDFVYQVYLGKYDLVIGDITIRYNRTRYADFTIPYTESGIAMIVPVHKAVNKNTFIFLMPLTTDLWLGSIVLFIYTGITILILEPKIRTSLKGSLSGHLGTIMYLSVFGYQEKLENILSKIVVIVWAFVLLVLTSSYTASLTSMLTVQQLQPTVTDIHDLQKNGEYVGYPRGSFVEGLLQELKFDKSRMRAYQPDEFAEALDKGSANGGVAAIVHEIPYIKLFLAKNCKSYTMVGPIYKTAGFGFAFPKGSPLVLEISRAILNITDGDDIIQLEKKWIGDETCLNNGGISVESNSLNFLSFWGLFLISGAVSTICLLIFAIISLFISPNEINPEEDEGLPIMNPEEDKDLRIMNPEEDEDLPIMNPEEDEEAHNDCENGTDTSPPLTNRAS